jgi:soluble lytic murein transglycosylase-like protein
VTKAFVSALALLCATATPVYAGSAQDTQAERATVQLGPNARALYQEIFSLIRASKWSDAITKLDAMPVGPLHNVARAEIYLGKGSPVVTGEALAELARKAPELPQSQQLVSLAAKRGVAALPSLPSAQELSWLGTSPRRGRTSSSGDALSGRMAARINPLIKDDRPNEAEAVVEEFESQLSSEGRTEWQQRVSWTYFLTGDDAGARRLGAKAQAGTGEWAAQADWVVGLAAWRQHDYKSAADNFASAARRSSDPEMLAAANFWAARAAMTNGQPDKVDGFLKAASRQTETFYGLLALQRLGLKAMPPAPASAATVEARPNVRAALALAEIGERKLADQLFRHQARIGDAREHAALATLAGGLDLPETQLWLAHNGPSGAQSAISARYPAPKGWTPTGGWRVDRSLVFAHALQESRFRADVTSHAGAKGLMQVMPGTARQMAAQRGEAVGSLNAPSVNLEYGQTYIEHLRDLGETGGLLPKVIAAYNAGPTPIGKWNLRMRDNADPLMYIESMPYWETRAYVTIILRNYWMYQQKDGKKADSLSAMAQGMWPRFPGLSGATAVRLDGTGRVQSAD